MRAAHPLLTTTPSPIPGIRNAGGDPPSQCPELALLPAPGECARHRRPIAPKVDAICSCVIPA